MIIRGITPDDRAVIERLAENYAFQAERKGMIAMVVDLADAAHMIALVERLATELRQLTPRERRPAAIAPLVSQIGGTTVHVLRGGVALCGFTEDVPAEWPAGHRWVSITDGINPSEPWPRSSLWCPGCKTAMEARAAVVRHMAAPTGTEI